jgi:hypothetical protein
MDRLISEKVLLLLFKFSSHAKTVYARCCWPFNFTIFLVNFSLLLVVHRIHIKIFIEISMKLPCGPDPDPHKKQNPDPHQAKVEPGSASAENEKQNLDLRYNDADP